MKNKNIIKNEEGISLLMRTILMVLITVIIAAIIAVLVLHSNNMNEPNNNEEKNLNIQYYDKDRISITGGSPGEVERVIASINKNSCYLKTEGGVKYNPIEANFYASGPIGSCGERYK